MVGLSSLTSKNDKKAWENYISNFEKSVLFSQNNFSNNTKPNDNNFVLKNENSLRHLKNFKRKKLVPDISLDLHGHTLHSAKLLLQKFIFNCYEKNTRDLLIITGKGQNNKGALKEEVPKWLNDKYFSKYLVNYSVAPKHFGGEGALLVRIKNRYKNI